jgi:TPR repeat protein
MHKMILLAIAVFLAFGIQVHAQTPQQSRAWAGDSLAMLELSESFTFGKNGVEKNEDSAQYYVRKAAEKGLPDAEFLLGTELLVDVFSAANYAKGVGYLKKAAEKGHVDAQYRLCEIHSNKGRGNIGNTYYDLKKAYLYGEMAAQQGLPEALMYCAEAKLKASGTTPNDSIAVVYFRRAATEKNYVPGYIRMGDMYFEGKVTGQVEPFLAVEWYRKALSFRHANIDQKGKAETGIHNVDQFFKRIQNTFLEANPAMPMGMFSYRIR